MTYETVSANTLFWFFVATIGIVRLWLFVFPVAGPTIAGVRVHHYAIGALGSVLAAALHAAVPYAISLALVADELTYLLMGGESHEDNYSSISLIGTALIVSAAFLFRHVLFEPVV